MYDSASGGGTLSNPLTTDSVNGEIEFWLDEPRRVDLKITKSGYTTRTVTVDVSDSGDEEASTDVARTFTAAQTFSAKVTLDTVGGNSNGPTIVGAESGGAVMNFKPTHEDGYSQINFHPEQGAEPDVIFTVHKEASGTETNHRHLSVYASPSIGAAPTGRLDMWYGQSPTVWLFSDSFLAFNTDSYWNLDVADLGWWNSGSTNGDFEIRGNATGSSRGIKLTNTAASGHSWRMGELPAVGRLALQDLTASGQPLVFTLDGTNQRLGLGTNATAPGKSLTIDPTVVTLTEAVSTGTSAAIELVPRYSGAFTVTLHNYLFASNPTLTNSAVVTHAPLVFFDAAAGTHPGVDAATTKTTPGGVDAWVKINVNGTIHYVPSYTSKTA